MLFDVALHIWVSRQLIIICWLFRAVQNPDCMDRQFILARRNTVANSMSRRWVFFTNGRSEINTFR